MTGVGQLQACLAGEHAALYAYGVLGGVLAATAPGSSDQAYAVASYDAHRSRRDRLIEEVTSQGATPVAAEPAYVVPFPVTTPAASRRLGRLVERRCANRYGLAVAATAELTRQFVAAALTDCAIRAVRWRATPQAFPGVPEL